MEPLGNFASKEYTKDHGRSCSGRGRFELLKCRLSETLNLIGLSPESLQSIKQSQLQNLSSSRLSETLPPLTNSEDALGNLIAPMMNPSVQRVGVQCLRDRLRHDRGLEIVLSAEPCLLRVS